jgi:hypothetical protein
MVGKDGLLYPQTGATPAVASAANNPKVGLVIFLLVCFGGCWWMFQPDNSPEAQAERAMTDGRVATAVLCENAVTNQLRSPATADYPFGHVSTVTKTADGYFRLESHVDSQNGFGATTRTRFVCLVSGSGSDISGYKVHQLNVQ